MKILSYTMLNQKYWQYWKALKLLHEYRYTIYLLLYVHACSLCASWCVKAWYCERKFWCLPCGHWNPKYLENGAQFTHWMSQNFNSVKLVSFLWIDLTYKCFVKKTRLLSKMYKLPNITVSHVHCVMWLSQLKIAEPVINRW